MAYLTAVLHRLLKTQVAKPKTGAASPPAPTTATPDPLGAFIGNGAFSSGHATVSVNAAATAAKSDKSRDKSTQRLAPKGMVPGPVVDEGDVGRLCAPPPANNPAATAAARLTASTPAATAAVRPPPPAAAREINGGSNAVPITLLDVGGGRCDLSCYVLSTLPPTAKVVIIDNNPPSLQAGIELATRLGVRDRVAFVEGDVFDLEDRCWEKLKLYGEPEPKGHLRFGGKRMYFALSGAGRMLHAHPSQQDHERHSNSARKKNRIRVDAITPSGDTDLVVQCSAASVEPWTLTADTLAERDCWIRLLTPMQELFGVVTHVLALHACGRLSDVAMQFACAIDAEFVVVPCCFTKFIAPGEFRDWGSVAKAHHDATAAAAAAAAAVPDDHAVAASTAAEAVSSRGTAWAEAKRRHEAKHEQAEHDGSLPQPPYSLDVLRVALTKLAEHNDANNRPTAFTAMSIINTLRMRYLRSLDPRFTLSIEWFDNSASKKNGVIVRQRIAKGH